MAGEVTNRTMDIWSTPGWKGHIFQVDWRER
jgi:hypothetical protein